MKNQIASANLDEKLLKRQKAIIDSMTPKERRNPDVLKASRKKRIAAGSGTKVEEVNRLLKMHRQMADMMKAMGGGSAARSQASDNARHGRRTAKPGTDAAACRENAGRRRGLPGAPGTLPGLGGKLPGLGGTAHRLAAEFWKEEVGSTKGNGMSLKIRLARAGAKKRPHFRVVVADLRFPRDGRFIENVGTYNPMLPKDSKERVKLDLERMKHWLSKGAQPTDRVLRFLDAAGVRKRAPRNNPQRRPARRAEEAGGSRGRARRRGPQLLRQRPPRPQPKRRPVRLRRAEPNLAAKRIRVAKIGAAHGIRGEVRLLRRCGRSACGTSLARSRTRPAARNSRSRRCVKRTAIWSFASRASPTATRPSGSRTSSCSCRASACPGKRTRTPSIKPIWSGCESKSTEGVVLGTVAAIRNFGAGDLLEIAPAKGGDTFMIPFVERFVPTVDIKGERVVVDPPEGTVE